jgi:hypothetical protein
MTSQVIKQWNVLGSNWCNSAGSSTAYSRSRLTTWQVYVSVVLDASVCYLGLRGAFYHPCHLRALAWVRA